MPEARGIRNATQRELTARVKKLSPVFRRKANPNTSEWARGWNGQAPTTIVGNTAQREFPNTI